MFPGCFGYFDYYGDYCYYDCPYSLECEDYYYDWLYYGRNY